MNKWQADVRDFHHACGIPYAKEFKIELLSPERNKLRRSLIKEEGRELRKAYQDDNTLEILDGSCDLIVVTLGGLVEMGVDLDPFWNEVHRTNMAKADGPMREDGKKLKPEGWTPPDLAGVLGKYLGGHDAA